MSEWVAVLYGVIQGLSEFLPISSSGHLALLPHFLAVEDPGLLFDLSMHAGTALATLIYFRRDFAKLFRREGWGRAHNLILATGVSGLAIFALKGAAEEYGRAPALIAFNLIAFGLFMWLADRKSPSRSALDLNKQCRVIPIAVGLFQALAVFPGVSRSGATLGVARLWGVPPEEAARFSFTLSVPIIAAGMIYKLPAFLKSDLPFELLPCLIGMGVSCAAGFAAIHFFLKVIRRIGLGPFCLYRIALALAVLAFAL